MAELTNSFVAGKMERDLDERMIPEGTYRYALNIDVVSDEGSNVGSARNKKGNTLVASIPTNPNARTIGAVKYEADNLVYWLVSGDNYDGIFEYNEITGEIFRVLQTTKASPIDASTLNFSKRYIVTGINYVNGFLYWTDNFNPPRKINIARSKSYDIDDIRISDDISVILRPSLINPTITLYNDPLIDSNNIEEKFLSFSYRYKYIDGQYSSMSPLSPVAFQPKQFALDYDIGFNKAMVNKYNSVDVTFETGGPNVLEVQLLMHDTRNSNISVVESFNKEQLGLGDFVQYTFKFNNNKTYTVLTPDQLTRKFDNVPLLAKAQDFVGNRLMYGNYTQFYDIADCDGSDINVNIELGYSSQSVPFNTPLSTWRSDRDYEVAVEYMDEYGRTSTALTSSKNTVYIPPTASDKANSLDVKIKHKAPCWASNYRIIVKQSKKSFYNLFPRAMYASGAFRYILIPDSDRDKFAVGDYIIVKATNAGPTYSNKKYKIIEFEQKEENFLPNTTGYELAGLYIKIKVDNGELNPLDGVTSYYNGSPGCSTGYPVSSTSGLSSIDRPIYYGDNDGSVLSSVSAPLNFAFDLRITVQVLSATSFRYTIKIDEAGGWQTVNNIVIGSNIVLTHYNLGINIATIKFNSTPIAGDKWKIMVRRSVVVPNAVNLFNGTTGSVSTVNNNLSTYNGFNGAAVLNPDPYSSVDFPISYGDEIVIRIDTDLYNPYVYTSSQIFYSDGNYANIEEWFIESGAYMNFKHWNKLGIDKGAENVFFVRGNLYTLLASNNNTPYTQITPNANGKVFMIIEGYGFNTSKDINRFSANINVKKVNNALILETVAKDSDLDIFHETTRTFPIVNGLHQTDSLFNPGNVDQAENSGLVSTAVVRLNNPNSFNTDFNAWSFGNGLESDRIKDDFNATELGYSPRVNAPVEEYKQKISENAICYSGIYGENTGVNKLNEFNLSIANFRYLDKEFGSIQKLHARDTDLLVFQENKVTKVLYGKNLMFDAFGGSQVTSIPEVLGTQVAYPGEWGISKNPESFAEWGGSIYFTDARRGVVLQMLGDQIQVISEYGMANDFQKLMSTEPNFQKLGGYDPDNQMYVLSPNDRSTEKCKLTLSRTELKVGYGPGSLGVDLFQVISNSAWTISLVDLGDGTGWVSGFSTTGYGTQDITAVVAGNTGAVRQVKFVVAYCDGLTAEFTLVQGRGKKGGKIIFFVLNNEVL